MAIDGVEISCPDCERRNNPDAHFCRHCGVRMVGRTVRRHRVAARPPLAGAEQLRRRARAALVLHG